MNRKSLLGVAVCVAVIWGFSGSAISPAAGAGSPGGLGKNILSEGTPGSVNGSFPQSFWHG